MDYSNFIPQSGLSVKIANHFMTASGRNLWGPRAITDYEFIYQVEGAGLYEETGGRRIVLSANELLLIPPMVGHTFSCAESLPAVISCIHFTPQKKIRPPLPATVFNADGDIEILALFKKSAREFNHPSPFSGPLLSAMLSEIWIRLSRLEKSGPVREPMKLKMAREYAGLHFRTGIGRRDLADYLDVTPEHVNLLFRRHLGVTPVSYVRDLRIREARELLQNTPMTVSEVARATGFNDPLYFSRVFRKATGSSPSAFGKSV